MCKSGELPDALGELTSLETLSLSHIDFCRDIPDSADKGFARDGLPVCP